MMTDQEFERIWSEALNHSDKMDFIDEEKMNTIISDSIRHPGRVVMERIVPEERVVVVPRNLVEILYEPDFSYKKWVEFLYSLFHTEQELINFGRGIPQVMNEPLMVHQVDQINHLLEEMMEFYTTCYSPRSNIQYRVDLNHLAEVIDFTDAVFPSEKYWGWSHVRQQAIDQDRAFEQGIGSLMKFRGSALFRQMTPVNSKFEIDLSLSEHAHDLPVREKETADGVRVAQDQESLSSFD